MVITPATSAVTVSTCAAGRPALARIAPLTNRMYAIVMNVVAPPTSSTSIVEPEARIPNRRSMVTPSYIDEDGVSRLTQIMILDGLRRNSDDRSVELARGTVGDAKPWAITLATFARRLTSGQITLAATDGKRYSIALDRGMIVAA